jgi:hypothetical protein
MKRMAALLREGKDAADVMCRLDARLHR